MQIVANKDSIRAVYETLTIREKEYADELETYSVLRSQVPLRVATGAALPNLSVAEHSRQVRKYTHTKFRPIVDESFIDREIPAVIGTLLGVLHSSLDDSVTIGERDIPTSQARVVFSDTELAIIPDVIKGADYISGNPLRKMLARVRRLKLLPEMPTDKRLPERYTGVGLQTLVHNVFSDVVDVLHEEEEYQRVRVTPTDMKVGLSYFDPRNIANYGEDFFQIHGMEKENFGTVAHNFRRKILMDEPPNNWRHCFYKLPRRNIEIGTRIISGRAIYDSVLGNDHEFFDNIVDL